MARENEVLLESIEVPSVPEDEGQAGGGDEGGEGHGGRAFEISAAVWKDSPHHHKQKRQCEVR